MRNHANLGSVWMRSCVYVRARVRALVRACVRACVHALGVFNTGEILAVQFRIDLTWMAE